jgi:hypothetical protein
MLSRMKRLLVPVAVVAAVLLSATCSMGTPATSADEKPADETSMDDTSDDMTMERTTENARYRVTFSSDWTAATHPTNFPSSSSPHFSPLVGATHGDSAPIWQLGELASDGIKVMAETGRKPPLLAEVNDLIAAGTAHESLSGNGLRRPPDSVTLEFDVVPAHPHVTLVSMLFPSPDWFVGVSGLSLLDEDGDWEEIMEVKLLLYDAGTDDGATYTATDVASDPAQPISLLTTDQADTDFTDGAPAVGTFVFEKIN